VSLARRLFNFRTFFQENWARTAIFLLDLGNAQFPEFRCFLLLVALHAPQNVIEHFYGRQNVRTFVQHYTVCALRHCSIRDFGA